MNNHYIPRLLIKKFGINSSVNVYDFKSETIKTQKIKNTFSENNIYDEDLEKSFAVKLEGPFGDLLNHKLLKGEKVLLKREENMLLRKFFMFNCLRAPIKKCSWNEMLDKTELWNHPSAIKAEILCRYSKEYKKRFDNLFNKDNYIYNLKKALEINSIEGICMSGFKEFYKTQGLNRDAALFLAADLTRMAVTAVWDCSDTGQEFILPKLSGISMTDYRGEWYKFYVVHEIQTKKNYHYLLQEEIDRLLRESASWPQNFEMFPISPTRIIIYFSPYFRLFFPLQDDWKMEPAFPPLLDKEQFDKHFFKPMRMELFKPCKNTCQKFYEYEVKKLTAAEVYDINSILLNMETDQFVFHDYNKIRDSLWYYDKIAKFAEEKKHDFSRWN